MDNWTFFQVYLLSIVICLTITIGLIIFINKGLKRFFKNLCQDEDIAKFFLKLTNIILVFAGLSAGLKNDYYCDEDSNWLTITWDAADQIKESIHSLLLLLTIFAIVFFILNLIAKKLNK